VLSSLPPTLLSLYSRGNYSALVSVIDTYLCDRLCDRLCSNANLRELQGDCHYILNNPTAAEHCYLAAMDLYKAEADASERAADERTSTSTRASTPTSTKTLTSSYILFKLACTTVQTFPAIPQHLTGANVAAGMDVLEDTVLPYVKRIPSNHMSSIMSLYCARLYSLLPGNEDTIAKLYLQSIQLDPYTVLAVSGKEVTIYIADDQRVVGAFEAGRKTLVERNARKRSLVGKASSSTASSTTDEEMSEIELQKLDELGMSTIRGWYGDAHDLAKVYDKYRSQGNSSEFLIKSMLDVTDDAQSCKALYEELRATRDTVVEGMGWYGWLLYDESNVPSSVDVSNRLSELAYDLVRVNASCAEAWVVMGLFILSPLERYDVLSVVPKLGYSNNEEGVAPDQSVNLGNGKERNVQQLELALKMIDKSLALSPSPAAFLARAIALLMLGKDGQAVVAIKKCVMGGSGVPKCADRSVQNAYVTILIRNGMVREALSFGKSAERSDLMGVCLAHLGGKYKAKALSVLMACSREGGGGDEGTVGDVVLAQLLISENRLMESARVLEKCLGLGIDWYVHAKMGVCYVLMVPQQIDKALKCYQTAISLGSAEAVDGLEKLEGGMQDDEGEEGY
jgi:tetratricopeptide (TPR) repeat protein